MSERYRATLNQYERRLPATAFSFEIPSRTDWIIATFLVVVQQNAFTATAFELVHPGEPFNGSDNGFNTASISLSIVLLAVGCVRVWPLISGLALRNVYSILFIVVVLSSVIWSLHPDLSLRRGCAYVLTIAIAGYIAVRFTTEQALLVLTRSFAFCGVCSVIFVLLLPETGIMSGGDLDGNWRGVYPHKNLLGFAMAIAVFAQMYLIASARRRSLSAYAWAMFFLFLVIVSQSTTALIISLFYIFLTVGYLVWRENKIIGYNILLFSLYLIVLLGATFLLDPDFFLDLIGKDPTLTGRTDVWEAVIELIGHKPLLGWGYRAMWVPTDPTTLWVDARTGDWGVPSAHNAILEVTLELGLLGLGSIALVICVSFWRGLRCCALGLLPFGLFSLAFFASTIIAGQTIETIGTNQEIDWLVFNILGFIAGEKLAAASSLKR